MHEISAQPITMDMRYTPFVATWRNCFYFRYNIYNSVISFNNLCHISFRHRFIDRITFDRWTFNFFFFFLLYTLLGWKFWHSRLRGIFDNFVIDSKLILQIRNIDFYFFFSFFFEMLLNVFHSRIDSAW